MKVRVRYFASVREALGVSDELCETAATTLGDLRAELMQRVGGEVLGPDRAVRMALDHVMQPPSTPLHEGCEVAFFPPVTGG